MEFNQFQKELRQSLMPSGDELAKLAQKKVKINKEIIENNFNDYLSKLLTLEFDIYKNYERKCSKAIIEQAFKEGYLHETGSLENHVKFLFELLDYQFERHTILNGKVDYLIPSESAFRKNRTACVVISIKRTLRERWRQVVGELSSTNAGKIYILTADDDISTAKAEEIGKHNVHLIVWDEYKKEKFSDFAFVLGYTEFAKIDLPASKNFWERLI